MKRLPSWVKLVGKLVFIPIAFILVLTILFAINRGCTKVEAKLWPVGVSLECPPCISNDITQPKNKTAENFPHTENIPSSASDKSQENIDTDDFDIIVLPDEPKTSPVSLNELQRQWHGKGFEIRILGNTSRHIDSKINNFYIPHISDNMKQKFMHDWCSKNKACITCEFHPSGDYTNSKAVTVGLTRNAERYVRYTGKRKIQIPYGEKQEVYVCTK